MTSSPKTHIAILDRNVGLLQWMGEYATEEEALADFDRQIRIYPAGEELDLDDWKFFSLTAEQAAKVEAWSNADCPSSEIPACIDR